MMFLLFCSLSHLRVVVIDRLHLRLRLEKEVKINNESNQTTLQTGWNEELTKMNKVNNIPRSKP